MNDKETLEKIKRKLLKYNYYDVLAKISLLNTLSRNQDNNILIACLINNLIYEKNTHSKTIISLSCFNKIVKELDNLSIARNIDPVENLFYDSVVLDDQYLSYENININPSYILNHIIVALNDLSKKLEKNIFFDKAKKIISFLLQLQTNIIIKSNEKNPIDRNYTREMNFYNSNYYNKMKDEIYVNYDYADSLTDGEINNLILDNSIKNTSAVNNINVYSYFYKPFFKVNEKLLVLDPTILTTTCTHYIILLAEKYGLKSKLIESFKESILNEVSDSIKKIDKNYKIYKLTSNTKQINYLLEKFSDQKVMLHLIVSDDENSYCEDSLLDSGINNSLSIDKYITNYINQLKEKYDEVYINILALTFGRGFSIQSKIPHIALTPYQLFIISKTNRISNNILYYFAKDICYKQYNQYNFFEIYGDFQYFIVYDEYNCSFYINDSIPQNNVNFFIGFDIIYEYVFKTFSTKNNNAVIYNNEYIKLTHIENNKYFGIINNYPTFIIKGKKNYFCLIQPFKDEKNYAFYICECLSYWLSEAIDFIDFNVEYIFIEIAYHNNETSLNIKQTSYNKYQIVFGDNYLKYLSNDNLDNSTEKNFFTIVLEKIGLKMSSIDITNIFKNKFKKKLYTSDCKYIEYMIPSENNAYPIPIASQSKLSELLDNFGFYFIDKNLIKIGDVIEGEKRSNLCNQIVGYIFDIFKNEITNYDYKTVINISYSSFEKLIPEITLRNDNYKNQIHLYPDKSKEIQQIISEYNKTSIALKFILEYVGATQVKGNKKCDFIDLENLLAYAVSIIEWATASDLFKYNMIDDKITVLESKRFGYDKKNVEIISNYISNTQFDFLSKDEKNDSLKINQNDKNNIYQKDFGYSFTEYITIIGLLFEYGNTLDSDVKNISYENWIKLCNENNVPNRLHNIINDISIEKREDYFKYKHYKQNEFYPWRFNRLFSLFRRPIIKIDNNYFWGNKNLNHNIHYISALINQGIFNSGKKKKNYSIQYNGTIAMQRGEFFNNKVYEIFKSFPNMDVFKNIVSVNSNHIADASGNDLGDIDILVIAKDLKKILIIEVKDYSLAKNINDLSIEIKKLFEGDKKDKPAYEKHLARFNWMKNHKDDIIKEFKLDNNNWNLIPLFITNQPMVSKQYKKFKNINLIDYNNLTYKYIEKLK